MALSALDDESRRPTDADLDRVLGKARPLWQDLLARVARSFPQATTEWGFASKGTGWGLRLRQPKRTILYMTPCVGYFLASFALGEKAARAALASGLPAPILDAIRSAKKYAEGRGVRIEVRRKADLPAIERIALLKMEN
jgi:hypothetical protein